MNADLGKTTFSPEEIDDLRERLKSHKDRLGLSWADLAKITGVTSGTLSAWVPGTYNKGEIHKNMDVPTRIHRFFQSVAEKAALEATMPSEPDFQMTVSASRMIKVLQLSHMGDMGLISSPPGVGKTAAVKQYAATRANVFVVTVSPATRGVPYVLLAVLAAMGEAGAKGTPQGLSSRVRARVRDAGALIIVDEAQHLSSQALEELRSIHDETECGIVLVGDETLITVLKKFPQLYSRLGIRHSQPRPTTEDISTLAEAWGVPRGAELSYLMEIGRRAGGLRTITKTLRLAVRGAMAGGAPMEVADLKDAFAQRFGEGG